MSNKLYYFGGQVHYSQFYDQLNDIKYIPFEVKIDCQKELNKINEEIINAFNPNYRRKVTMEQLDFKNYYYNIKACELFERSELTLKNGKIVHGEKGDFIIVDPITEEQDIVKREQFLKIFQDQHSAINVKDIMILDGGAKSN